MTEYGLWVDGRSVGYVKSNFLPRVKDEYFYDSTQHIVERVSHAIPDKQKLETIVQVFITAKIPKDAFDISKP